MVATPNYAGMFLRGYGSQNHVKNNGVKPGNTATNHASGAINSIQGDGTRPVYGLFNIYTFTQNNDFTDDSHVNNQVFTGTTFHWHTLATSWVDSQKSKAVMKSSNVIMHNNRLVPIANKIRPVNMAVRYLIRCR